MKNADRMRLKYKLEEIGTLGFSVGFLMLEMCILNKISGPIFKFPSLL